MSCLFSFFCLVVVVCGCLALLLFGVVGCCGFLVLVGCFLCLGFLVGCLWVLGVVLGCFLFKMS